ncbi:dihydrofolate reductase family protein [Microbacterium sp. P01]|uniref:dihydrofolate reductase family protein n=1 Tax=Microbacterium sp. P01 TaxID=3366261 RepID=UPI00366E3AA4
MTRIRMDLFASLDGFTAAPGNVGENPMGEDWGALTAAYAATRTFRAKVFADTSGAGTTGVDDAYATAFFTGVGAEIMGAGMFGVHAHPDDPDWKGWWGEDPPFGFPVYVLTHSAPRPSLRFGGGTAFHFRTGPIEGVLDEAIAAAGSLDVRIGGGISTAREFLSAGLVDDLHVGIAPIVLGRGNGVWENLRGLELSHAVSTEVAESGTIHVTFTR